MKVLGIIKYTCRIPTIFSFQMDIHQNNVLDTSLNDQNDDIVDNSVDLLVKQKVNEICMKTSDPKGAFKQITEYIGSLSHHQREQRSKYSKRTKKQIGD